MAQSDPYGLHVVRIVDGTIWETPNFIGVPDDVQGVLIRLYENRSIKEIFNYYLNGLPLKEEKGWINFDEYLKKNKANHIKFRTEVPKHFGAPQIFREHCWPAFGTR